MLLFSSPSVAALRSREETTLARAAMELLLDEGIHLDEGAPGGEHHGVVGSGGREDVAPVVASKGVAGGNTLVFPIRVCMS